MGHLFLSASPWCGASLHFISSAEPSTQAHMGRIVRLYKWPVRKEAVPAAPPPPTVMGLQLASSGSHDQSPDFHCGYQAQGWRVVVWCKGGGGSVWKNWNTRRKKKNLLFRLCYCPRLEIYCYISGATICIDMGGNHRLPSSHSAVLSVTAVLGHD